MTHEIRDLAEARRFVCEGLWLQRVAGPTAASVKPSLSWALEVAGGGQPLPPSGFVGDVGHLALGYETDSRNRRSEALPGIPSGLLREYEDHVLGKFFVDTGFERASFALRRYQQRDRIRGIAFLINQFVDGAGFAGVLLSPAVIKALIQLSPDDVLTEGRDGLARHGPQPLLLEVIESMVTAGRRTAEVLAPEDVFELEHGTALAELGQRVALRQVLQAAEQLASGLPLLPRPLSRHSRDVPTRVLDEDFYPVGGYSSVSTRGSIESLLPSQLAYMEQREGFDLFDVKYLRHELLYYSRDENQFLRHRRSFVFCLSANLVHTRFKDAGLPWQRCIFWLGFLYTAVRRLIDWLSDDALSFEIGFLAKNEVQPLEDERHLLELLLREQLANGTVRLTSFSSIEAAQEHCRQLARRSQCQLLMVSTDAIEATRVENVEVGALQVAESPRLLPDAEEPMESEGPLEAWIAVLDQYLHRGL